MQSVRRRQWHPTPVLLPGKSHGWRSLVGCSPWGRYELGTTERLHFHFSLSCIGEGNGNPLQYSCLENPRDGGAWWAAVYGVTQSRTRLKQLGSSNSMQSVQGLSSINKKWLTLLWVRRSSFCINHTKLELWTFAFRLIWKYQLFLIVKVSANLLVLTGTMLFTLLSWTLQLVFPRNYRWFYDSLIIIFWILFSKEYNMAKFNL